MKKLLALVMALAMLLGSVSALAEVPSYVNLDSACPAVKEGTENVTLSILTTRNSTATNDIEDVWFFQYLADAMNVKLEMEQTLETNERISLMFASDDMPDLVWGIGLSNNDVMTYGVEEGMLLSWNDLLTPELMPNACKAREEYPDAFVAATAPDGNIYAMPEITGSRYHANTGSFSAAIRMYINQEWLAKCGLEKPTTLDDFLKVLRTFKEKDPAGLGDAMIPMIGNQNKDKEFVWNALGFYGRNTNQWGMAWEIKNGEVVLPCYTEEAREFIKFYHTLYEEGLISQDYFTMDQTSARGLIGSGVCGVFGDSTIASLGDAWAAWDALSPLTSDVNDTAVASMNNTFNTGICYASSATKYPEVLARIVDYMYSPEGALLYFYGPMKGGDKPLYNVDGWFLDENGKVTTDKVVAGEYSDISEYTYQYIKSYSSAPGRYDKLPETVCKMAGTEYKGDIRTITDKLTGATVQSTVMDVVTDDNNDGHWRTIQSNALVNNLTTIRLPNVYLTAEQNQRVADLYTVINDHVTAETAKFIVGTRSLDELDAYFAELKKLGIEEYIQIYRDAYAGFTATLPKN